MKMRGNPELVVLRNVYYLAAFLILISSFAGCAAGSCLSYGHSCWGAHGKRSGVVVRPADNFAGSASDGRKIGAPPSLGERWLFSRLVNRQLAQVPMRGRMFAEQPMIVPQPLDDDAGVPSNIKHSTLLEKMSGNANLRDISRGEQRMGEGESPDILLIPQNKEFINDDQAMKFRLYKILKNIDEKLK